MGREPGMNAIIFDDVDWMAEAICPSHTQVDFFPHGKDLAARAIGVCLQCPVQNACYLFAKKNRIKAGVWGGHYFGY